LYRRGLARAGGRCVAFGGGLVLAAGVAGWFMFFIKNRENLKKQKSLMLPRCLKFEILENGVGAGWSKARQKSAFLRL